MDNQKQTKKNDFIELKYTGYANNEIFDSNIEEDLKKINPKAKVEKLIVAVGQEMVVKGFDKELENKEIDKDYEINIKSADAFGPRNRDLIRTLPLKGFTQQNMNPRPGMILALDNNIVKIIAVSGARVIVDFNNPLAGKDLKYNFKIIRKIDDEKEKIKSMLKFYLGTIPEFEVKDKIIVKVQKEYEPIIKLYNEKFKELLGKELMFEEKKEEKAEKNKHEHIHEKGHENNDHPGHNEHTHYSERPK